MTFWAYAALGERMGAACLAALLEQARRELRLFKVGHVTMVLWSLCVMQVSMPGAALALQRSSVISSVLLAGCGRVWQVVVRSKSKPLHRALDIMPQE